MVVGHRRGPGRRRAPAVAVVVLALVAVACGGGRSTPDVTQVPEAATDADPELRAEARALQRRWEEAENRGLGFYAPEHMARASEQIEALDSLARSGAGEGRIRDALGELEGELEAAERARARADSLAGPLLERWGLLRELAGADVAEARPRARAALRDVMRQIEDGEDPGDAIAAAERRLRTVQARVLEEQLLAPVRSRIEELASDGAGERAPRSLRRARAALEEARAAIERAPFDVPAATRRAWRADDAVERARRVADRVRRLQELEGPDLEQEVLAEVLHLERSAELLGGGVGPGRSVEDALEWQGRQLDRLRNRGLEAAAARASAGPSGGTEGLGTGLVAVPGWLDRPAAARGFSAPAVPPPPAGRIETVRDPPPPVRIDTGTDPGGTVQLAGGDRGTGALRIGGRGETRFVVDVVMLVVENGDRVGAFRDRWRGQVITGPSDGGAGHYLIGNASYYLNMAPVQEAIRAAGPLPDGATYTFSSLDAMGTFGTALRAQQAGFDARVLWLDDEGGSP